MPNNDSTKPHLVLVDAATELPESYDDRINVIIKKLMADKLANTPIDVAAAMAQLDFDQDNSRLQAWMADNNVATKAHWNRLAGKIARDARVNAELGFVPKDAVDFVCRYAEREGLKLSPRGTIQRKRGFKLHDSRGRESDEITAANAGACRESQLMFDVANSEGANLDSLGRELRLVVDRLNLGYRDTVIADALATWQEDTNRQAKVAALLAINFTKGAATGTRGTEMWAAMERACFDVSGSKPGFAVAVIKKFMWQVKRKARFLDVTNHLMPVLTGAQGKGKSQFVSAMTAPLHDLLRKVDFNMLTDGKTTDIWSSLILFIDEMGFFSNADVDQVKNIITSDELSVRMMRQNHSTVVVNQASLIGCSNKVLEQLIRDDTGVRRFAELAWSNTPDWEAANAVDWKLLWQSVDEMGPDPLVAADMMSILREQQEANRNQHPVEVWSREFAPAYRNWSRASDMHASYREWERVAFPRSDVSVSTFGKQMTALQSMIDFPLEKGRNKDGVVYRYKAGGAR